ncbi:hypothetical protein HNY73_010684 [Argiope bruennichi]|uniref:Uncharacterized protein n=1 Tax=Argiope bruennichi TaxID=94029 RepID=A0A8T0F1V3_ARGBR|nr:hypothetical protein HNY73_010684 [Argiope bruennichi]
MSGSNAKKQFVSLGLKESLDRIIDCKRVRCERKKFKEYIVARRSKLHSQIRPRVLTSSTSTSNSTSSVKLLIIKRVVLTPTIV